MTVLALAATPAATAGPCGGDEANVYVFSRVGAFLPPNGANVSVVGHPTVTPKGLGCDAVDEDTRVLYPGSNQVEVRYADDVTVPVLKGHVKGLGLDVAFDMPRTLSLQSSVLTFVFGASYTYDGPWLPLDPAQRGELRVTVELPAGPIVDVWRTSA